MGQPERRYVGRRHRPQSRTLRRHHALALPGRARGVVDPGGLVESQVVTRSGTRIRPGDGLEGDRPVGRFLLPDDDHPLHGSQVGKRPLGECRDGAAVVEEVRQLLFRRSRVEQDADRPGAQHSEPALHQLDPVAQMDRDPVPTSYPEPRQVPRHSAGALLQLPVGDGTSVVAVCGPATDPSRVFPQDVRQCTHRLAPVSSHSHPFVPHRERSPYDSRRRTAV